ncbi:hypothetical protein RSAG8_08779, partial [Rhizoctonia solani AG-8 WAC10335]
MCWPPPSTEPHPNPDLADVFQLSGYEYATLWITRRVDGLPLHPTTPPISSLYRRRRRFRCAWLQV